MKPLPYRFRRILCLAGTVIMIAAAACVSYKPQPLDREAVDHALAPPPMETVRVEARELDHPILPPLEFDDRDGMSPEEAAVLAVLANPDLRSVRDQRGLADAQVLEAGVLPNPQLSYSLEAPTGGAKAGEINAYGWGLDWDVSSLISRRQRMKSARAGRDAADLDIAWQEWQTAQAAKLSAYRLLALQRELESAREDWSQRSQSLEKLRRGVEAGEVTRGDLTAGEESANQARSTLLELEQSALEEKAALLRLLGLPPDYELRLQEAAFPDRLDLPPAEDLLDGLEDRRLDLVALRKGYESEEATLHAAVQDQFPPVSIGLVHNRDTGNVITTGFGITIGLPLFDRNQAAISREKATRQTLFDEYVSRVAQARSDVAMLLVEVGPLNEMVASARDGVENLTALSSSYERALAEGQTDAVTYYGVLDSLLNRRLELAALREQLVELRIALELATGRYDLAVTPKEEP